MTILLGWLYLYVTRLHSNTTGVNHDSDLKHVIAFVSSLIVLYGAMGSPVAFLAENTSFPLFVVQMLLMTLVLPWLIHASIPSWIWSSIFEVKWVYKAFRVLTHPYTALVMYNAIASLFLLPAVFDANLHYNWLHILDQGVLMITAIFLWWPLTNNSTEFPRLSKGLQLLYVLFGSNFMMPIPVLLLIAQHPWYDPYVSSTTHSLLAAIAGQQMGGLLMIIGMACVYGLLSFKRFFAYEGQTWYE